MSEQNTVAVLGGGNGAFATAAALKFKGHRVHLFEVPELAEATIDPLQGRGAIEVVAEEDVSVPSGNVEVDLVTSDPAEALDGAGIILYVVPAYAEQRFTELCLPFFRPEQLVVLFCGNFGGALELANQFTRYGIKERPLIAETEGLVFTGFKQDATTVKMGGYKSDLACAALPGQKVQDALGRLRSLFSDFQPVANVLVTSLRNLNPIVHAPVTILNAGRIAADKRRWRYYWEGVTEAVGNMVQGVDEERLAVANSLGMALPSMQSTLLKWYGKQGAEGDTLAAILSTNPAYEVAWAPSTLEHRFLTEDIPFGLVPLEAMASALNVQTPLISAHITLANRLLDRDFRTTGRHLARLGLDGLGADQIKRLVEEE